MILTALNVSGVIQGKNYVILHVDNNGNINNVELVRHIDRDLDRQTLDLSKSLTNLDSKYWGKDIVVPVTYDGMCENGNTTLTRDRILLDNARVIGDRVIYYDDSGEIYFVGSCSMPTFPRRRPSTDEFH